ncbi:MAG: type II secretion system protein [Phycisphaerae bacterium]
MSVASPLVGDEPGDHVSSHQSPILGKGEAPASPLVGDENPFVPSSLPAFTLIELVVVIGIISLLAAVSLPGIARMWEENRLSATQGTLKGLLMSARARARNDTEKGLFFYLENGVQKVVFIEADPPDYTLRPGPDGVIGTLDDVQSPDAQNNVTEQDTADRFRVIAEDKVYEFPPPFRVVPREAIDSGVWNNSQLSNENHQVQPGTGPLNHRNFFTVIFSPSGRLITRDVVLIRDGVEEFPGVGGGPGGDERGAMTGLVIDSATQYVDENGTASPSFAPGVALPAMIVDSVSAGNNAINFPSVDGLLVYDDSVFVEYPEAALGDGMTQRKYLMQSARPLYITRQTGALIRGPVGESEPPAS